MIGQTISHYKILEELGSGGMGVVYKAEDTKLRRTVALKFLPSELTRDKDAKKRFIHEAQAASALQHHNICTIHEIDETPDGRMFICMDRYDGETLKQKIARGPLPVEEALDIVIQAAEGLSKAHEAGVVHRDIKPANVLITSDGVVKIVDFGLAKLGGQTRVTKTGTTVGTIAYMSPEQASGQEVDARSDMFSLGAVLYELLTGKLPFKGDHEAAVLYGIMHNDPGPLSEYRTDTPTDLQLVIDKALAKNPDERYLIAADMCRDIKRLQAGSRPLIRRRRFLRYGLSAALIVSAAVLLTILKPFRVEIAPDQAAIAAGNSLAIMYFENLVDKDDPERWGEIVTNLLITDLSESESVRVVSSQRLYDILKQKGEEGRKVIDRTTATEVAHDAGAKWMLLGSILQEEPSFIVTSQLVDVGTGEIISSQRITGDASEKVFSLVDKLTREVRNDLDLPVQDEEEPDLPVTDITTHSEDAYRYYVEGMNYLNAYALGEANKSFQRALEYDSTLVMAYYRQTGRFMPGTTTEKKELIDKAMPYVEKATGKERLLIRSRSDFLSGDTEGAREKLESLVEEFQDDKGAYMDLGSIYRYGESDYEKAISVYRRVVELDPLYAPVYNALAYCYSHIGIADSAFWAINQFVDLKPDDANAYNTRGDLLVQNLGMIDRGIESYKESLARDPDLYNSRVKLGHLSLHKKEYDTAKAYFQAVTKSSSADGRARGRLGLAFIPLYQGRLQEAIDVLQSGMSADEMENYQGAAYFWKLFCKVAIYFEQRGAKRVVEETEKLVGFWQHTPWTAPFLVYVFAKYNDFARAEEILVAARSTVVDTTSVGQMAFYWISRGWVELETGSFDSACTTLEKASPAIWGFWLHGQYPLGLAYLKAGRLADAVRVFQDIITKPRMAGDVGDYCAIWAVKAHYYLGVAYEESGWQDKAVKQYEEFLEVWKDADPGIPVVEEARRRLAALKGM
jgi:serine/threonine protein kinase/tetratricopeptide (TPR) repeat protein